MSERIGVAVIGLGVIGRRMLEQVARRDDFVVCAAWDIDAAARERAAKDFPGTPIASDARSAIADPRTRVVYVGTPPAFHRDYSLMAAAERRKVFCEKPLAVDVAQGERLVGEMQASGTPNAVNFVFASAPAARALARTISESAIGRPLGVEARLFFARWPREWQQGAAWLKYRAEGGFIREVMSHYVYLMLDVFGDCVLRSAIVDYPPGDGLCERSGAAILDCAGVPAIVSASAGGAGPDEVVFTVRGERGALRLENWHGLRRGDGESWEEVPVAFAPHPDARVAAYQAQLDALACFARGEPHRLPTMADALKVQRVIEAMLAGD